jgi:hypothetical protein
METTLDLTGTTVGALQVLHRDTTALKGVNWVCLCERCGRTISKKAKYLYDGPHQHQSCGRKGCRRMPLKEDLTGKVFNVLVVLGLANKRRLDAKGRTKRLWACRCNTCGTVINVSTGDLKSGKSTSCGRAGCRAQGLDPLWSGLLDVYSSYKRSRNAKKLGFSLTLDQVYQLTSSVCAYCGGGPRLERCGRGKSTGYRYNGIDRVVNSIGYTLANCLPCCVTCNVAKSNMTPAEWAAYLLRMGHYRLRVSMQAHHAHAIANPGKQQLQWTGEPLVWSPHDRKRTRRNKGNAVTAKNAVAYENNAQTNDVSQLLDAAAVPCGRNEVPVRRDGV